MSEAVEVHTWATQRRNLLAAVHRATSSVNTGLTLKGSFATGEFHLSRRTQQTFSDVDLVLADDGRDRHAWESEVCGKLASLGWELRVSVQHFDSTFGISAEDSRMLTVGELVRFWGSRGVPGFSPYMIAKTTISLLRTFAHLQSPRVMCDPMFMKAIHARTGYSESFTAAESASILSPYAPRGGAVRTYLNMLADNEVDVGRSWFLRTLRASSVDDWLKFRMAEIVESESAA